MLIDTEKLPPLHLSDDEAEIWQVFVNSPHLTSVDLPTLETLVRWYCLNRVLLANAAQNPNDLGKINAAVTATSCIDKLLTKLGLSPSDRKYLAITPPRPVPQPRRKRSLDELLPSDIAKLGAN